MLAATPDVNAFALLTILFCLGAIALVMAVSVPFMLSRIVHATERQADQLRAISKQLDYLCRAKAAELESRG